VSGRRGAQPDLGGFDPRFLGITLRFGSTEEWQRFRAETYAFAASELAALPADEAFTYVAEMTVAEHELRHFHDFLLSSYGQKLFRWKLQAFFNGHNALKALVRAARERGANCLPIPLARWCRMPDEERHGQVEQWNRGPKRPPDGDVWRPPDVPLLPDDIQISQPLVGKLEEGPDSLRRLLAAAVRAYDQIGYLLQNPSTAKARTPLQPWHVMEVSALLVQMQQIANTHGDVTAYRFVDALPNSGFPVSTVRLMQLLYKPWTDRKTAPATADLAAVVAWTLMGNYELDEWKACPTERIIRLFNHMVQYGPAPSGWPVTEKFKSWSKATGLSEPFEAIRQNVNDNEALVARYQSMMASARGIPGERTVALVLEAAKALHAGSSMMANAFEDGPEDYVYPDRYLHKLDGYARPVIRCEFDGIALRAPKFSSKFRKNWIIEFATEDAQGHRFIRTGVLKAAVPGKEFVKPETGLELYNKVLAIDYAFQPKNRLDWEFGEVARPALWSSIKLFPLHIIG
jgi:hypothetical protein